MGLDRTDDLEHRTCDGKAEGDELYPEAHRWQVLQS
jgi:hypothetical protein